MQININVNTIESMYESKCNERSDIHEHMPVIREYAEKCKHVTEFGVRDVVSTWALLAAKPEKCVSYDVNESMHVAETMRIATECMANWQFCKADTLKISIEPTDLLFIDTLHTYDQLSQELKLHHDKVSKYILMHDTTWHGDSGENGKQGLWKAVEDFLVQHAEWHLIERKTNNNGLTILGRNT